ncbi:MAG: NUDIX domain-containing protein [Patescibacteria group bacterium]
MNNEAQKRPFVKIGINVFVFKKNKILLGRRIGKVGQGTWCLPGGKFEFGESLNEAAKRELKEETSLSANLKLWQIINAPRKKTHYVHFNFLAKKWRGEPKIAEPDKFSAWKWFDLKRPPKNIFFGHRKFIPAYINKIHFVDRRKNNKLL